MFEAFSNTIGTWQLKMNSLLTTFKIGLGGGYRIGSFGISVLRLNMENRI